jgi:exodeoxyribonuclease-3
MAWLNAFHDWIKEQAAQYPHWWWPATTTSRRKTATCTIRPHGKAWCMCRPRARAAQRLLDIGLTDAFRMFEQPDKSFSWWDYRGLGFRLNKGLRIDHLLLSDALKQRCTACIIDRVPRKWEQPSDHTPVVATFD